MIFVILNILIFLGIIFVLKTMANKHFSFSKRVFIALIVGIVFGIILNNIYPKEIVMQSKEYFDIVGKGYVSLLKMIAMPLIMISILTAIINLKDTNEASKMGALVIGVLLSTAAIASLLSTFVTLGFGLNAGSIVAGDREIQAGERILTRVSQVNQSISEKVVSFIPSNIFLDMTNARATSTIAVVIFSIFFGFAILGVKKKKEASAVILIDVINSLHDVILRLVTIILRLTPYGVLALITSVTATSEYSEIFKLIKFVGASYVSIFLMYLIHLLIVSILGFSPIIFVKKTLGVLTFAFTSRTSAGSIPLTIKTQESLGVDTGIANIAATFGSSIGQNGCAAIYPTMLVMMIAPTLGINPLDIVFILKVVLVVTISSLGVAGVGGGATFAAIIVLSTLGFPVALAGLLISVEPLIDMGRTALNVNDSILAGLVSSKILNKVDKNKYNDMENIG